MRRRAQQGEGTLNGELENAEIESLIISSLRARGLLRKKRSEMRYARVFLLEGRGSRLWPSLWMMEKFTRVLPYEESQPPLEIPSLLAASLPQSVLDAVAAS
jgi:hypothetical protein